jgi:hypothetical protein
LVAHKSWGTAGILTKLFLTLQAGTSIKYQFLSFYLFKNMWFSAIADVKTLASDENGL